MTIPDPTLVDWVPLWSAGPVSGYVPTAQIKRTTDQVIPTGTLTVLSTDATPVWDTDGMAGTAGRITCKTAGYYLVQCRIRWAAAVAGTVRNLVVFKSVPAVGDVRIIDDGKVPNAGIGADHNCSTPVYLNVNDYIYPSVYHDAGSNQSVLGAVSPNVMCSLTATFLGPNVALGAVIPPTYGTSLPASPADGQEAILTDNPAGPNYWWRFRYNALSVSGFKWEFIGGIPIAPADIQTQEQTNSAAYVDLATVGPTAIAVPRTGDYDISFGAHSQGPIGKYPLLAPKLGSAAVNNIDWAIALNTAGTIEVPAVRSIRRTLTAGDVVKLQYASDGTAICYFRNRWLRVQPVRVS